MGCDIHVCVEIKKDGKWLFYNQPSVNRHYQLFEKMAGVRGEKSEAIALPRGFPDDVSETTKLCCDEWAPEAHSASWLSSKEIAVLEKWYEELMGDHHCFNKQFGYLFGHGFAWFAEHPDEREGYPKWLEDVRLVFWFDN